MPASEAMAPSRSASGSFSVNSLTNCTSHAAYPASTTAATERSRSLVSLSPATPNRTHRMAPFSPTFETATD